MEWLVVTDSSCDLLDVDTESPEIAYETVPFMMNMDGKDYTDDPELNVAEMVDVMEKSSKSFSACPSPGAWAEKFAQAKHVIAFTISGRLSGSYSSAMAARDMVLEAYPEKQIEVIDSLSTGPKLVLLAQQAVRQIQEQVSFEKICSSCREFAKSAKTIFTLTSFHNLVQNGRVSKIAGFLASKLSIRVIGIGTQEGVIHFQGMVRGEKKCLRNIVESMEEGGYQGKPMAISHCLNRQLAEDLKNLILDKWQDAAIQILPTRGLDSYYAERNGLIVTYPCATV